MRELTSARVRSSAPPDAVHVPFVVASLAIALGIGLTLAVALPIQVAIGSIDIGWLAHAQVHGHAQVVGFAALFVLGVAARLAPRFAARPLAMPQLVRPALWLLLAGVMARIVGQPVAQHAPFAVLMTVGALLELLGAMTAFVVFSLTLRPLRRGVSPHELLLWAAPAWLLAQALVGAWWLAELASDGQRFIPATRDAALLHMQVFGVLGSALVGVGLRTFPTFFGAQSATSARAWTIAALVQGGLLAWTGGALAQAADPQFSSVPGAAGQLAVGLGLLLFAASTGWWALRHRLAPASRGLMWGLRPVLASLTVTGALLALGAAQALADGRPVSIVVNDAARHVFLIGVVTLGIVTMAQLILPEFASERFVRQPGGWRGPFFGAALASAAVLRGLLPWAGLEGSARHWGMAAAGVLALVALAVFAVLFARAHRAHGAYLLRLAGRRRGEAIPLREGER